MSLDVTYIDEALAGWEQFKSTLPDLNNLLEQGDLMFRTWKNDNSNNGRV